ncbi:MAG: TadE/TadG family type IV pilus assembly protein [Terracidiphilus sp.]|jgi:Flp pilus assembly protein TadG
MKWPGMSILRRLLKEQRGQSAVLVAVVLTSVFALAGASVEVGHVYYAYQRLVASTNAATLAGAQTMPTAIADSSTPLTPVSAAVKLYSCAPGGYNATSMLQCQTPVTTLKCLSTVTNTFNVGCEYPPGGSAAYNSLKVVQTATVHLWFGGLIGMSQMNMSATGTAAMKGGTDIPYNLAIIMDTTASMTDTMTSGICSGEEQIECAVQGFSTMLGFMDPCALNTTCSSGSPYVDDVALFVFPAINTSYKANDYKTDYCYSGRQTSDASVPYNFQNPGNPPTGLAMDTTNPTWVSVQVAGAYELIPFENTYKASDSASVKVSDALAEAVGYANSGCPGLGAPGGQGTYYAQAIYAAQAALALQQTNNPGSQNVMIILSDGNATACNTQTSTGEGASGCGNNQIFADNCPTLTTSSTSATPCPSPYSGQPLNGTSYSYSTGSGKNKVTHNIQPAGYHSPNYPSALGECGQAVQAAQAATAAGTTVYAISFDSPTTSSSSNCGTDVTYTLTGLSNGAQTWPGGSHSRSPCNAIAAMASNANTFYSDYTDNTKGGGSGCDAITTTNQNQNSLPDIFKAIVQGLTIPRLIPNGTT